MSGYTRPYLYPKQLDALFCPERWALVEASTKSGKTVGCLAWLLEQALQGPPGANYWWVAPNYLQSGIAFRRMKSGLTQGSFVSYESPVPRLDLLTRTSIWFRSGDDPDGLYGEDVYAAVMDEASRVKEDSWFALRSTLTATRGPCRIIGNVKGRKNWFYHMARRAEAGEPNYHFSRITAADAVEAGVLDKDEIEDARRSLPENIFRELYMAEAGDDGGNPFGLVHIEACVNKLGLSDRAPVAFGIDLAKKQDYFVVIGLDEFGFVCRFERWQGLPWRASIKRVHEIVGEDTPALVDSTGLGDPVLEELQHEHGNFSGYIFSAASKQRLMEGLAVSIQGREVHYPDGPIRAELDLFEYVLTRTGVKYSAPEGSHDDCVASLALARQQWAEVVPGASLMAYYSNQMSSVRQAPEPKETLPYKDDSDDLANVIENELTQLYNETVAKNLPSEQRNCARCGHPVLGPSRISDGVKVWHNECVKAQVLV